MRKLLLAIVAAVSCGCAAVDVGCGFVGVERPGDLQVSAAKGALGLVLTNREAAPLEACDATVREGGDEWTAVVPGNVQPLQTVEIVWTDFKHRLGERMPDYIGARADRILVSCRLQSTRERKDAGLRF